MNRPDAPEGGQRRIHPMANLNWQDAHVVPIQMRYSDVDGMGHLNNAVYASYFEVGRIAMLEEMGKTLEDIQTVVARLEIDYVEEIKLGQKIEIQTLAERIGNSSYTSVMRVLADGKPKAYARSVQVNLGADGKSQTVPEWMRRWLEPLQVR